MAAAAASGPVARGGFCWARSSAPSDAANTTPAPTRGSVPAMSVLLIAPAARAGVRRRRDGVLRRAVERFERRAEFSARQQAGSRAQEHLLGRRAAIEQHADEAVAHLVPVLGTPHDLR